MVLSGGVKPGVRHARHRGVFLLIASCTRTHSKTFRGRV
ncbi:MAG: hypothetical protein AVDCRST_MAG83-1438 [uncultured Arthrobacter sp.]|uniref:Uncharacterized protein n=1 Tax=uncultured Arthrobacter sp. TaxID=114050 RepID=A0A6J4HZ10_9MICC|nr:MAG: hypothetical protein AVDCRST_MAG83-1438 [uncultured Arthrobacter sp.]